MHRSTPTTNPIDVDRSQSVTGMAQRQRARLITARSQDQNLLPVFYNSCALKKYTVNASDAKQAPFHRRGAEVARTAHNREVTRSKRVAGILQFVCFKEVHRQC